MPENEEQKPTETPKTFTQEQVNALLAEQRRKVESKFPDYDELKTSKAELDKIKSASQTEIEKALERANQAETKLSAYEAKEQAAQWAAEIVKDSEIPASVLRGNTREELQAHFDQLKDLAPKPARTPVPVGKASGDSASRAASALRSLRGQ